MKEGRQSEQIPDSVVAQVQKRQHHSQENFHENSLKMKLDPVADRFRFYVVSNGTRGANDDLALSTSQLRMQAG
ncbi:unnamed protein product [Mycena citricolor]|uniref:Uncharacterized protein n=1 Tax=Mycena citricolor TaxID=2018698 RepID=A0AAD2GZX0_9AGAR|nr:unnamed protein product [Mycena citricolor]